MKIKKRHVVLASLVLALSAAVYLNWQLSSSQPMTVGSTNKELGAATYVNSSVSASADEVMADKSSGRDDTSLTAAQREYFATSRSERKKTEDDVIALAKETLELADSSDEAKEEAVEQLSAIEDILLSQNRIETAVKSKGFTDCMCILSDTACTVIVPENEMQDNSALIIKDCVLDSVSMPFENINIIEI